MKVRIKLFADNDNNGKKSSKKRDNGEIKETLKPAETTTEIPNDEFKKFNGDPKKAAKEKFEKEKFGKETEKELNNLRKEDVKKNIKGVATKVKDHFKNNKKTYMIVGGTGLVAGTAVGGHAIYKNAKKKKKAEETRRRFFNDDNNKE